MMNQVNNLMRAENKMLEAYFDLKSAYYINADKYLTAELILQVEATLNKT